ncbi:MAG: DUF1573 domain-containing protein [Bacteroidales bacterium]|nr:DUF1573 domain-containing protein [Bacteroidales bacterium]
MKASNVLSLTDFSRFGAFIAGVCLAWSTSMSGQTPRLLRFTQPVMEIDTVRYDAGALALHFTFENISDKPVTILDVRTQCGCAKPSFSRESVAPGHYGNIDVLFDPSHLFAEQDRHLTVIATNGDYRKFSTLTVHGYVQRDVTEEEIRFPYELADGLRASIDTVGMRLTRSRETSVKEMSIYNSSGSIKSLSCMSAYSNVKAGTQVRLAPGESAKVTVSVDTSGLPEGDWQLSFFIVADGIPTRDIILKGAIGKLEGNQD